MGNWNPTLVTPTQTSYGAAGSGASPSMLSTGIDGKHGLIGLVLVSVAVLVILNYAGFRFVFTAGKR